MDFKQGIGSLNCRICGASFQMTIHNLHEPIDVFSEWLDDCEAAQTQRSNAEGGVPQYDDEDDDIPQSSGMGRNTGASARSIDLEKVGDSDED